LSQDVQQLIDGDLSLFRCLVGFSVAQREMPQLLPELKALREQHRVGFAWFSDTVVIYATSDDDASCSNVLETVGWLLFTTMSVQTRLRVGIGYGQFFADTINEIYVGPALVEAYELERAQEWSGAALSQNAAARVNASTGEPHEWVCEYPVPIKQECMDNASCSNLAVDWTQGIHRGLELKWSPTADEPSEEERHGAVYTKWKNTRQFHEDVCATCRPKNRKTRS
jgi:hypothetical protein